MKRRGEVAMMKRDAAMSAPSPPRNAASVSSAPSVVKSLSRWAEPLGRTSRATIGNRGAGPVPIPIPDPIPIPRCSVQSERSRTAHVSNDRFTTEITEGTEVDIMNGPLVTTDRGEIDMMNETLP
jgi:hypothetical protein